MGYFLMKWIIWPMVAGAIAAAIAFFCAFLVSRRPLLPVILGWAIGTVFTLKYLHNFLGNIWSLLTGHPTFFFWAVLQLAFAVGTAAALFLGHQSRRNRLYLGRR